MIERSPDGRRHGVAIGIVVDTHDSDGSERVKVRLPAFDEALEVWARVAAPGAGGRHGAWLPPALDDEVVVAFQGGDLRQPVVVGSLWSSKDERPAADDGEWAIESPSGACLRFGTADGDPMRHALKLTTEGGNTVELRRDGAILITDGLGCSVRLEAGKVVITANGNVEVNASTIRLNAGIVETRRTLKAETIIVNAVVAHSYTPGAGNIW